MHSLYFKLLTAISKRLYKVQECLRIFFSSLQSCRHTSWREAITLPSALSWEFIVVLGYQKFTDISFHLKVWSPTRNAVDNRVPRLNIQKQMKENKKNVRLSRLAQAKSHQQEETLLPTQIIFYKSSRLANEFFPTTRTHYFRSIIADAP